MFSVSKLPCFGSGNFLEMFGSFGVVGQILGGCSSNYRNEGTTNITQTSQENLPFTGEENLPLSVGSPNGKIRKRSL